MSKVITLPVIRIERLDALQSMRRYARRMLKDKSLRRGPFIITDEYLRDFLKRTSPKALRRGHSHD